MVRHGSHGPQDQPELARVPARGYLRRPTGKHPMLSRNIILGITFLVVLFTVHLAYVGHIRPTAQHAIDTARAEERATPRTAEVVLKDIEQEICIILSICCLILMLDKSYRIYAQRYLFDVDLLGAGNPGQGPPALSALDGLDAAVRDAPLVRTLMASIRRFEATGDLHNAAEVIDSNIETTSMKLEAENNMIRYIIWAIPSIGFVGTVRGIGTALVEADRALAGDIASMTEALGVAFNSTFVALILSIALTLVLHLLQGLQDRLVLDIEDYCDRHLVKRLVADRSTQADPGGAVAAD